MKPVLFALFLFIFTAAFAQVESPFGGIRHSAADQTGNMHLRWDDFSEGQGVTECYYSAGTNNWTNAPTSTYSITEMEAQVPYTYGQKLRYRLRFYMDYMGESFSALHPAFWDAEAFPPNINRMAYIGTDATGDSVSMYSPNLDLEESYVAKGPQKLYFGMNNLSGSFPTMTDLTHYNVYMGIILNPETVSDSIAYAMVYSFTIPGLISNGLYKLGLTEGSDIPTFTRLGNIQAQVSSGTLHLACTFSDLTSDPDFGAWPNLSNSLVVEGASIGVTLVNMQPSLGFGDYCTPAILVMEDNFYQQASNTLPIAQADSYSTSTRLFSLSYSDPQGDFPLVAEVETPSGTVVQAVPQGQDFNTPVTYSALIPDETLDHIDWRFSDNGSDFVTGTYNIVSISDPTSVPMALNCQTANPIQDWPLSIHIGGLKQEPLSVCLFNIRGQKVAELYQATPDKGELELNYNGLANGQNLASGIYFISARQAQQSTVHKFVKIK